MNPIDRPANLPSYPAELFAGRVLVVTGGTRGIGLEIAAQLLEGGAAVIVAGRSEERGAAAVDTLQRAYPEGKVAFVAADVASAQACSALFDSAEARFGAVTGLVNCADSFTEGSRGRLAELDPAVFGRVFGSAAVPLMILLHAAIPRLAAAGGGSIVTFASDSGRIAGAWQTMVGATKASMMMLTRAVSLEVASLGINVNCVSPSYVRGTAVFDAVAGSAGGERVRRAQERAGLGLPEAADVARLATFLCTPWARHITGQVISINGGLNAA